MCGVIALTKGQSDLRVRLHGRTEGRSESYTPSVQHWPWPLFQSDLFSDSSGKRTYVNRAPSWLLREASPVYVPISFQISVSGIGMTYGPLAIPSPNSDTTNEEQCIVFINFKVHASVKIEPWGIWVGSTCTRQCRHAEHEAYHVYSTRYMSQIDEVCKSSYRRCSVQGG